MSIGTHLGDASRQITGEVTTANTSVNVGMFITGSGVFVGGTGSEYLVNNTSPVSGITVSRTLRFDVSRVVPVDNEFRGTSISLAAYVAY